MTFDSWSTIRKVAHFYQKIQAKIGRAQNVNSSLDLVVAHKPKTRAKAVGNEATKSQYLIILIVKNICPS